MSGDMAHHVEPLDIDCNSDFDNKENTFNHNNVLPCTEKGYEELDVSELNMKLRYSVTPTASPMSKSYTNCTDNRNFDCDETFNYTLNESNLTRSLNSTVTKNESVIKSFKNLPLQSLSIDKNIEKNNSSMGKAESAIISECNNITVTINGTSDIDDNISSSSTTSSVLHTPEATTPTKEISKTDGGSPILRGLKSVLNMFRSSQSPITPADDNSSADKHAISTPTEGVQTKPADKPQAIASTPIATSRLKESNGSRRSSPYKDSIVFNDDLEKELQWKDETTIIFSHEKIPVHKLFFQQTKAIPKNEANQIASNMENKTEEDLNTAVETTDITYNKSVMGDKIIPAMQEDILKNENYASNDSDSEFLDCETTFVNNEANTMENMEKELKNDKNFQDICSAFDHEEDNNKSINFKQEYIDSNLELIVTTEPTELIQNMEYNKSLHMMIDSLDDNVNEKRSVTEFKTYDKLKADDNILQLDNTKIVNQNNISISKPKLENNISSEYDMDSLEYNFMNKTNDIDVINNNNDIITNRLQESTMQETKAGNDVINSSNLTLPTEIPLPDEDNNKIELNTIGTNILTSDSVFHNIIANSEVKSTLNDTTEFKIISNTSCNVILEENIPSEKKDDFLIKNEEHEMNSYSNIQEEIYIIEGSSKETIHSSVENNNVFVTQAPIDHKGSELFDNLDTSKLCENNKINLISPKDQYNNSDSLCENFTKFQIHAKTDQDNLEFPCDSQIIKNMDKDMKFVPVHENVENVTDKENDRNSPDGAHSLHEIIVNNQIDLDNSNINKNKVESNLANVHEEFFLKKPIQDTITILETKENIEDKQILSNLLNINNKDNIDIVENDGNHERFIENTEIVLTESLPVILNSSENFENFEINLDANKKQLKEIEEKDCNAGTLAVSTDCNEYHNINVVSEYLNSSNTFTDKTVVDQNTDALASINNSLEEGNQSDKNVTVEHAEASSNELQLDKTIQKENEYIKEKEIKELTMNETTTSDINLTTNHIGIYETIESNTILLKKVTENDPIHIKCEVSNDKFENLIEEKAENIDQQSSKEVIIDTNFTHNGKCLNEDGNVNELDTFTLDEEIVLSENNSPYVSVSEDLNKVSIEQTTETFAQTENANTTITITNSPPITSKGYNFNFDEIEDPFASKTSHGMSSTTKNKNQNIESTINSTNLDQAQTPRKVSLNDRRKVQSERKKKLITQEKLNKTISIDTAESETLTNEEKLDYSSSIKDNANTKKFISDTIQTNIDGNLTVNNDKTFLSNNSDKTKDSEVLDLSNNISSPINEKTSITLEGSEMNKLSIASITAVSSTDNKNASSSDQSSYYSVNTSSDENIKSRNVFNIPELHNMNFNPCVVKSKLSQTPPPDFDIDNPFVTRSKLSISPETTMISHTNIEPHIIDSMHKLANRDCEDKMEMEPMEKVSSVNRSLDTCSSNASEKDITVKEIDTEDEDTIEGPFLDDLNADEMSCLDSENVDMMNFNDVPNQDNEDNADGEIFIDAEAFQFLLNQNKSNVVADSGKESLFLKFDPLFAKRISSDSVITALSKIQSKQSTPMKISKQQNIMLAADSSSTLNESCNKDNMNTMETNTDNLNVTISKPMMVVPPAVNAIATPRKSQTPTRTNRLSGTFTSPAMAVIDRLLSLSANNSLVEHEATFTQASREQNEANLALTQLRELLAEKEIHVYNLRSESRDLKDRLITLESHMSALEAESQQRLKKIEELTETLSKRSSMDRNMAVVFEEYESTIANLIAQIEKEKKQHAEERAALIKERNEQTAHLTNMEVSFNDLHSKYEKIKQVIANYKSNEESYKKTLMMYEENFTKAQNNYELLKQHATSKLNYANEELQKINKTHEAEVLKMNAMIKRKDLHITSLEETLAQKTKANEELTAICDELINKVG